MFLKYFKTLKKKVLEYDKMYKKGATNPFLNKKENNKPKEQIYLWVED